MTRDARKGANEAWFRELNERLEQRAAGNTQKTEQFEIVCECAVEDCTERIEISIEEYEGVRCDSLAFAVVSGHVDLTCERVISQNDGYQVVEKFGEAAAIAEDRDPRS